MDTKKYTLQGFRMDYLKITQKEFADKLGLDVVTVSKLENEKINFSMNKQKKIIQEYGVKIEEGKIIVSDNEYSFHEPEEKYFSENRVPVYDVEVEAGFSSLILARDNFEIVGYVSMPESSDIDMYVKVKGPSMQPVFAPGDRIGVKKYEDIDFIPYGHAFVVVTNEISILKYLRKHSNSNLLILRSENPDFDDAEIKKSSIKSLWIVKSILKELI